MKLRTILGLAWAETRRSRAKLGFCLFAIAVGVAAMVAVRTVTYSQSAFGRKQDRPKDT